MYRRGRETPSVHKMKLNSRSGIGSSGDGGHFLKRSKILHELYNHSLSMHDSKHLKKLPEACGWMKNVMKFNKNKFEIHFLNFIFLLMNKNYPHFY